MSIFFQDIFFNQFFHSIWFGENIQQNLKGLFGSGITCLIIYIYEFKVYTCI